MQDAMLSASKHNKDMYALKYNSKFYISYIYIYNVYNVYNDRLLYFEAKQQIVVLFLRNPWQFGTPMDDVLKLHQWHLVSNQR